MNHSHILPLLDPDIDPRLTDHRPRKERVPSTPCLPARLPSMSVLRRDASRLATRGSPQPIQSPSEPDEVNDEPQPTRPARRSASSDKDSTATFRAAKWRPPPPFEIFRAIEQKDLMFLMEVRDRAFHLLLQKTGDATPLVHAMRIGESHRDVAIVLLGAFSRWINHLEEADILRPQTRLLLKALRVNLKLAIDYGLQQSQSDLLASFMQTLIMTEGDRWIAMSSLSIASELRLEVGGKPVRMAESLVRAFATKELGKAAAIASLDAYVANASIDLVLLGIWNLVMEKWPMDPIPAYFFARDERVYAAFKERLSHQNAVLSRIPRRLRNQIHVVTSVMEARSSSYQGKLEDLAKQLDE